MSRSDFRCSERNAAGIYCPTDHRQCSRRASCSSGLSSAPAGSLNYMLVNMNTGTVAANGSISAAGGTIDCANLPNGLYALKLFTPDGTEQAFKITLR